jgi:hypothetical protein
MAKLIGLACAAIFLFVAVPQQNNKFAKYKAVEAYEVRPGILAMPQYSEDGEVCEIGLQRRHYSPEIIRLDASMSREEIDQIVDEFAPADERGAKAAGLAGMDLIITDGVGMTQDIEYENILIQLESKASTDVKTTGEVIASNAAATIQWKARKCK